MKYIFVFIAYIIVNIIQYLLWTPFAVIIILYHFNLNPTLKRGLDSDGKFCKENDYKLWDWYFNREGIKNGRYVSYLNNHLNFFIY